MLVEIVKWTSYVLTALFGLLFAAACIYIAWHDREEKKRAEERGKASEMAMASREAVVHASVVLGLRAPLFFERPFQGKSFPGSLAFGFDDAGLGIVQSVTSTFGWFDNDGVEISLSFLRVKGDRDRPKNYRNYVAVEIGSPAWKDEFPGFSLSAPDGGRLDAMSDAADASVASSDRWGPITAPGLSDRIGPHMLYIHDIDEEEELLALFGNEELLDAITLPLGERGIIVETVGRGVLREGVFRAFWRVSEAPSGMEVMRMFCKTASMTDALVKAVGGRRFQLPHPPVCDEWR